MKMIAIIEVPDDMYDDYQDWYITSECFDDLVLRYEEDDAYMGFKMLGDELKLKPLPDKKTETIDVTGICYGKEVEEALKKCWINIGWNNCLEEIEGE